MLCTGSSKSGPHGRGVGAQSWLPQDVQKPERSSLTTAIPPPENHYVTRAPSREGPRVLRSGPGECLVLQKAQAVQGSRGGGCPGAHPTAGTHIPVLTICLSRSCPLVLTPGIPPGGSNERMGVMGRGSLLGRGQQGSEDPVVPPRKPKHLQHPRITLCSQPAFPSGSLPETPCHPSVPGSVSHVKDEHSRFPGRSSGMQEAGAGAGAGLRGCPAAAQGWHERQQCRGSRERLRDTLLGREKKNPSHGPQGNCQERGGMEQGGEQGYLVGERLARAAGSFHQHLPRLRYPSSHRADPTTR